MRKTCDTKDADQNKIDKQTRTRKEKRHWMKQENFKQTKKLNSYNPQRNEKDIASAKKRKEDYNKATFLNKNKFLGVRGKQ